MGKIRTFIAINLSSEIKDSIYKVEKSAASLMPGVRWVLVDNLHLTLKFLGDIEESRIDEIDCAIREAVSCLSSFEISLNGIGAFPSVKRANVIWIGIDAGKDILCNLAKNVDESLAKLGFELETKPFSGHVTIGRVKDPKKQPVIANALSSFEVGLVGSQMIKSIDIMSSNLTPHGSIYHILKNIELK